MKQPLLKYSVALTVDTIYSMYVHSLSARAHIVVATGRALEGHEWSGHRVRSAVASV